MSKKDALGVWLKIWNFQRLDRSTGMRSTRKVRDQEITLKDFKAWSIRVGHQWDAVLVSLLMATLDTSYVRLIGHRGKVFQLCFLDSLKTSPVEEQQGDLRGSLFCLSRAFTKYNTKRLWSDHHTETISALIIGKGYRFKRRDIRKLTETPPSLSCALYYINRTASQSIGLASHSTTSILLAVLCNRSERLQRGRDPGAIRKVRLHIPFCHSANYSLFSKSRM